MAAVNRLFPALRISARPLSASWLSSAPTADRGSSQSSPKPFSEIPGLKGLPFLGNVPRLIREVRSNKAAEENWLHKLHSELGPIYRLKVIGNMWNVVVSSPDAIEWVYRSEGRDPSRGPFEENVVWIHKQLKLPATMTLATKDIWRHRRSAISQQTIPRRVQNFAGPLSGIAENLIRHLESVQDRSGNVQDVSPELMKWAFQGVSYFVYGELADVYTGSDPLQNEFIEASMGYMHSYLVVMTSPPLYRLFPTKAYKQYAEPLKKLHKAGKEILKRRVEAIKDDMSSGTVDETKAMSLLDQWLVEGKLTEEEALAQSYDILATGIDNTASTAGFLLYELAKHPEIQDRLVQEISSVVGHKEHPSWEDLQKLSLLKNCFKETMRVYVPSDATSRILEENAVLDGYEVPAGTSVILTMHSASRDNRWFEDPDEFKPDRWDKKHAGKVHPFSYLPFGFGPRGCYGRRFAELELYVLMTKLLPKYRLSTDIQHMKTIKKLTLLPDLPLHIKFDRRD